MPQANGIQVAIPLNGFPHKKHSTSAKHIAIFSYFKRTEEIVRKIWLRDIVEPDDRSHSGSNSTTLEDSKYMSEDESMADDISGAL